MNRLRQALFWIHLASGLTAGLVIALLCATGVLLAFEKDIIAWAEQDTRRVEPPTLDAAPLSLAELEARFRQAAPAATVASIVAERDRQAAVAIFVDRTTAYYVDPYTGEVRPPPGSRTAAFLRGVVVWHRYLGSQAGEARANGKLITGVANLAFLLLAVTGLILWTPRTWSWRALRPGLWFRQNLPARARDLNWHQVIGFWSAPVFIVLTLTALPISFRWAGGLLYTLTDTPMPATGPESSGALPPLAAVEPPPAGAALLDADALVARAQREVPGWQVITYRPVAAGMAAPAFITVRERRSLPRTASTHLQFEPVSGELVRRDGYADLSAARKLRLWSRYLHSGEALGWGAQFVAMIASLGGVVLVGTGFALAGRRLYSARRAVATETVSEKAR